MKKLLVLSLFLLSPSLAFAHAAHFDLTPLSLTAGDTITYSDSAAGCHGAGCNSETPGWFWYDDASPASVYAWCGGRTSGTYAANCTKVAVPGQTSPAAGTYTVVVNLDHNCAFAPETKASCLAAGGFITSFSVSVAAYVPPGVSRTSLTTVFGGVKSNVSDVAYNIMSIVLKFVGLLIAAGLAWRFFKRHVGQPIGGVSVSHTPNEASANIRSNVSKRNTPWGHAD